MKVLTDTHTLVWALSDPDALGPEARRVLAEADVVASVANLWELCLKMRRQDSLLAEPIPWWKRYVVQARVPALAIRTAHVMALGRLPAIHKDPFDRILVAQSLVEKRPLVTKDASLARYGISVIW